MTRKRIRHVAAAAMIAGAGALGACAAMTRAGMAANEAEKPGTMLAWRGVMIEGVHAETYIVSRTCLIIGRADGLRDDSASGGGGVGVGLTQGSMAGVRSLRPMRAGKDATDYSGGAGIAVDVRGYFLTAAHCVDEQPMTLAAVDGGLVRWGPVRVVWSGERLDPPVDVAIVHAPVVPTAVVKWPARMPGRGEVLCCGSGLGSDRYCAGRITGMGGSTADSTFTTVTHDAPVSVGDSGGPAILATGELVGVNVLATLRFFGEGKPESTAVLPSETFVREIIERDFTERAKKGSR